MFFELLQQKPCRIIWTFYQKPYYEPETCKIGPKVVIWTCPDLPRPVQEDKSLSAKQVFAFMFSEITPFHFLLANLAGFLKIMCFTKQIYHFYETIGFTKQM